MVLKFVSSTFWQSAPLPKETVVVAFCTQCLFMHDIWQCSLFDLFLVWVLNLLSPGFLQVLKTDFFFFVNSTLPSICQSCYYPISVESSSTSLVKHMYYCLNSWVNQILQINGVCGIVLVIERDNSNMPKIQ